ncbi:hypothetical protein ElyMa_001210200 [Elysia marginata]|uniref:SMB domain-containing protein n=1 Tax=Elysia marginata TaxID=1093978 RepID=A0AAV4I7H4_9GAST|nr:hypothetical protein ElyMa_001210200 [Elysia marginata]
MSNFQPAHDSSMPISLFPSFDDGSSDGWNTLENFESKHEQENCTGLEDATPPPSSLNLEDVCDGDLSQWSCKNRCDHFGDWNDIGFTCSCNPTCILHEFCCSDFKTECPHEFEKAVGYVERFPGIFAVCDPVLGSHVVSTCPTHAPQAEWELCEGNPVASFKDDETMSILPDMPVVPELTPDNSIFRANLTGARDMNRVERAVTRLRETAPVSDSVLGWHFKNRFCWMCWQTKNLPIQWRMAIAMTAENRPPEDYRLETLIDFIEQYPDTVAWHPPPPLVRVPCVSEKNNYAGMEEVAAWCSACNVHQATQAACVNGSASYLRTGFTVYKNHHCLLCSKYYRQPNLLEFGDTHDFSLDPTVEETGPQYTCFPVEFIQNSFSYHNMYFPVTMVLPEQGNGNIKLIQPAQSIGSFTWNQLQCGTTEEESGGVSCVAEKCTDMALLIDGKCDDNYYPLQAVVRICVADPADGYLSCQPHQEETIMPKTELPVDDEKDTTTSSGKTLTNLFGVNIEKVQREFTETGEVIGTKYFGNHSLILSDIFDDPKEGLVTLLSWKVRRVWGQLEVLADAREETAANMREHFRWAIYARVETLGLGIPEPVIICTTWGEGLERPNRLKPPDIFSCDLALPCGTSTGRYPSGFEFSGVSVGSGTNRCQMLSSFRYLSVVLGLLLATANNRRG